MSINALHSDSEKCEFVTGKTRTKSGNTRRESKSTSGRMIDLQSHPHVAEESVPPYGQCRNDSAIVDDFSLLKKNI